MKDYKKTLLGSIVTFILCTSCCWMSSLAIWIGGFAFAGTIASYTENLKLYLFLITISLGILTIYLYLRKET